MNVATYGRESLSERAPRVSSNHNDKEKLTRERWEKILRYREDFFRDRVGDTRREDCVDQIVMESWLRSRQMGVDPHTICINSDGGRLAELREKHRVLLQAVSALIDPLIPVMVSQGYLFYLVDSSGLILLSEGIWTESEMLAGHASRSGILADERSEGTTAHDLCFRLKRPVQLLGPEHYCSAFQNRVASAAPILGDDGEAAAALVIFSPPLNNIQEMENQNTVRYPSSLRMVASLALAAETQIKQRRSGSNVAASRQQMAKLRADLLSAEESVASLHKLLAGSLALTDAGMVIADGTGKILQVNQEASRILQSRDGEIGNHEIQEYLSSGSSLMQRALDGERFVTEECIRLSGGKSHHYRIYANPILNQFTRTLDVMVLKIVPPDKKAEQISRHGGASADYCFADILGESQEIKAVIAQARRYASSIGNILILGESGTGKELIAQSIHNAYRPKGPFMAVNCAALPHELVGSELFGYEGGSFTGADRQGRPGKIELAHGGTLFLDEIGDMSLEHQAVLLRTLEDKKVMRVGGSRYKDVDFRLIAATNRNLAEKVREHSFREDLYYRISVLTLPISPLRQRVEDIPLTFIAPFSV